jgi:hypothetical protein
LGLGVKRKERVDAGEGGKYTQWNTRTTNPNSANLSFLEDMPSNQYLKDVIKPFILTQK